MFLNELKTYSGINHATISSLIQSDIETREGIWYVKQMGVLQVNVAIVVMWVLWEKPIGAKRK